ncbi:MAG: hypothetical protein JWM27_2994 [Gemmatimonadetes bacterium]|nr:hypothetical protein [Gemmatimonadota bacterium]
MLHIACAVLTLAAADTGRAPAVASLAAPAAQTTSEASAALPPAPELPAARPVDSPWSSWEPRATSTDTVPRPRRPLADYSDAYEKRLRIHRIASYVTLPLFAAQAVTGEQIGSKGTDAPGWARSAHGPLAFALGGLFAVNTYTGGLNLWEGRHDPDDRTRRLAHGLLMLAADGGFAATAFLGGGARESSSRRSAHRAAAYTSIGASLIGYAIMLPPLRKR